MADKVVVQVFVEIFHLFIPNCVIVLGAQTERHMYINPVNECRTTFMTAP